MDRETGAARRTALQAQPVALPWACPGSVGQQAALLARKAAAQAWSADEDIDWRLSPSRPWWLPRRNHVMLTSQFLHGERVAQAACERLLPLLPDGALSLAVASQIDDEARHAATYARYLARLGDIAPPCPVLDGAFRHITAWDGPAVGLVLATHVVLESEALSIQQDLARRFPCPILQRISRLAARDESRHLALGRLLLRAADLPSRPLEERLALHRRLHQFWRECARAVLVDHGSVLARAVPRSRVEAGWQRLAPVFQRVGLVGPGEERAFGMSQPGGRA